MILAFFVLILFSVVVLAASYGSNDVARKNSDLIAQLRRDDRIQDAILVAGLTVFFLSAATAVWYEHSAVNDKHATVSESFYWAVQTMTTVGYGDGLHQHASEFDYSWELHVAASGWMLVLALVWGHIVQAIWTILSLSWWP